MAEIIVYKLVIYTFRIAL